MRFFKIVFACLIAIGLYNFLDAFVGIALRSDVYECSKKTENPADVQILCKRLTRGQWWAK